MRNMIDQCEKYMAWIKHYASKLAYLLWLTPSGQVAHVTLDRRLCRTRIFSTFEIAKKWTMSIRNWGKVRGELEIMYPDRLMM